MRPTSSKPRPKQPKIKAFGTQLYLFGERQIGSMVLQTSCCRGITQLRHKNSVIHCKQGAQPPSTHLTVCSLHKQGSVTHRHGFECRVAWWAALASHGALGQHRHKATLIAWQGVRRGHVATHTAAGTNGTANVGHPVCKNIPATRKAGSCCHPSSCGFARNTSAPSIHHRTCARG